MPLPPCYNLQYSDPYIGMGLIEWFRSEFLVPKRLVFNLVWYGVQLFLFAYGWYSQETNPQLADLNTLRYCVWISRGAGLVLSLDGSLILVPVLRNLIRVVRPKLTWLFPAHENIWFHRQVAYSMAFWAMVHTTAHYINFINVERRQIRPENAVDIHYRQPAGITGHLMLFIMVLMYTTAHANIRKQCFEAFWYTHHLAFFFMIGFYTHATGCFVRGSAEPGFTKSFPFYDSKICLGYFTWRFAIWPGIIYFFERVWREIRARRVTKLDRVLVHPSGVVVLHINKPSLKYTAGQWLFLQVPEVSQFQWHPFTITSAPEDPFVSVHIRQFGDWTQALGERVGATPTVIHTIKHATGVVKNGESNTMQDGPDAYVELGRNASSPPLPVVRIDGPYGGPYVDAFRSEVAILIGAGIGVTPFASVLKHIWYRQKRGTLGALQRVEFFWIFREADSFRWFENLLQEVESAQTDLNFLHIHIYITQGSNPSPVNQPGTQHDPLTLLRTRTKYGRPDWISVYTDIRKAIETAQRSRGQSRMRAQTYFCGPNAVAKEVRHACNSMTSSTVEFSFVKEQF